MTDFFVSEDSKAILLLCCHLLPKSKIHPLTLTEYNNMAMVLYNLGLWPADLFHEKDLAHLAAKAKIKDGQRLQGLMALSSRLGFFFGRMAASWHLDSDSWRRFLS